MNIASRLRTWWKAMTHREQLNREIEEELVFHIQSYAEDLMRSGLSQEEAFRRARVELGGIPAQKENCRSAWGTRFWDELFGDLRYGVRMLAKSPGFTAIAIISLALGIGANTAIFGITKHVLLDKLAVQKPEELRLLAWTSMKNSVVHHSWGSWDQTPDGKSVSTSFSYPVYQQLRKQNHVFRDVFAFKNFPRLTATIGNQAQAVTAQLVSGNFYQSLGVNPQLGRVIQDADDGEPGKSPVAVISNEFWTRGFARSPDVIGKTIWLNFAPVTIVGVNPPGFTGASGTQTSPDIFLPFSMVQIATPSWTKKPLLSDSELWWVPVMARVAHGVPEETARASLDVVLNAAVHATMTIDKDASLPRLALQDGSRGEDFAARLLTKPVYVLSALAGFVLLLACANLANLLLARGSSRQREISVRLALGAGRRRILRQILTESLLLSFAGGLAGFLLGYFGRNLLPSLLSSSWDTDQMHVQFDWKIFAFTASVSILTGVLFGLAPALQATRVQVSSALKESAHSATQRNRNAAGRALVILQVTISMLLLVGALLFSQTLRNLGNSSLGFRPANLLLFDIQPPRTRYPEPKDIALYYRLEERLKAVPGVDAVTLSEVPLIANSVSTTNISPDGLPKRPDEESNVHINAVGQDFFSTMGTPILGGRSFNPRDTETSTPVAIINQQLAKQFFPNMNPLGRTVTMQKKHLQVIGISADAKYDSLRHTPPATLYLPYRQETEGEQSMTYEISTRMQPADIIPALRGAIASIDKNLPILDIRTQVEQISDTTKQERIFASLTSGFGVLAVVLACIGIYGIISYTVSRRTNELGLRMALGAQPARVLRMVLFEASWMAVAGVLVGISAALGMGRLIASMLYGLKPWDPPTLVIAAIVLILLSLVASWLPAKRAASIDPMKALRHE